MIIESWQLTKLANERLEAMKSAFVSLVPQWTEETAAHTWAGISAWALFIERAERLEDVDTSEFRAWCANQRSSHQKKLFHSGSKPAALECARLAGLIVALSQIESFLEEEEEARRTNED